MSVFLSLRSWLIDSRSSLKWAFIGFTKWSYMGHRNIKIYTWLSYCSHLLEQTKPNIFVELCPENCSWPWWKVCQATGPVMDRSITCVYQRTPTTDRPTVCCGRQNSSAAVARQVRLLRYTGSFGRCRLCNATPDRTDNKRTSTPLNHCGPDLSLQHPRHV